MATLGKAVIEFSADTAKFSGDVGRAAHIFEKNLAKMERHAVDLGRVVAAGTAIAGASIVKLGADALRSMDDLNKMAQRVGAGTEFLSGLTYAAKLSDVSVESLSTGLRQLAKNMQDAAAGSGDAKVAFRAMGMDVTTVSGTLKNTESALFEIADKFEAMEDGAGKTALAMKIFGRSGAELIPLLNQGAAGLKANADEARRFGLVISSEAAKKAEEFNDQITRMGEAVRGLSVDLTGKALPSLMNFIEQLSEGARIAGGFWAAVGRFGLSMSPFGEPGEQIAKINAEIARLQGLRARSIEQGRTGLLPNIDGALEAERQRLQFAQLLQRQQALALPGGDTAGERGLMRGNRKLAAPLLPNSEAIAAAAKRIAEGERILNEVFAQQAKEIFAVDSGLEDMVTTYDSLGNKLVVTTEQFQRMNLAAAEAGKIISDALNGPLVEAAQAAVDLSDRYVYTWDAAGNRVAVLREKFEELNKSTMDWGFTFDSAIEGLIDKSAKFSDVLRAIGQDLARMFIRQAVTAPLGKWASSVFGSIFGGARAFGGPVTAGEAYMVGERGPEMFVPAASGTIVPNGAMGGPVFQVDMRGADVAAVRRLERLVAHLDGTLEQRAVAANANFLNRGGQR